MSKDNIKAQKLTYEEEIVEIIHHPERHPGRFIGDKNWARQNANMKRIAKRLEGQE